MPGPFELVIILAIVILIFGGKRLKNLGSDLGGAIKGFKSSVKDAEAEEEEAIEVEEIDDHEDAEIGTSYDTSEENPENNSTREQ